MKYILILLVCLCLISCDDPASSKDTGAVIEVVSKTFKITEQNEYYWYFSWQTDLKNTGDKNAEVFYKVNFRDCDNYVIDYSYRSVNIAVGQQVNCAGLCLIYADQASKVWRMTVNISSIYD